MGDLSFWGIVRSPFAFNWEIMVAELTWMLHCDRFGRFDGGIRGTVGVGEESLRPSDLIDACDITELGTFCM